MENFPSFCINLKHHPQKWDITKSQLLKYNFNPIRIEAINGNELTESDINKYASPFANYIIQNPQQRRLHEQLNTKNGIGCYLSHYNCWKKVIDENLPGAFIFEDDIQFDNNEMKNFNNYIQNLPINIDVFSFAYSTTRDTFVEELPNNFIKCKFFFGLQGYYVSNLGAQKLIKYAFPIECHVDAYISLLNNLNIITLIFAKKSCGYQNNITGSSIQKYKCIMCEINNYVPKTNYMFYFILIIIFCVILKTLRVFTIS